MNASQRRILRDLKRIVEDRKVRQAKKEADEFVVTTSANDIYNWDVVLFGPEQTAWENSHFRMKISFPKDYPHTCPTVKFVDIPFHPNIYQNGNICLDILQANWSSSYDVTGIMTSIRSLLDAPNPHSPANNEAAELYVKNMPEYVRRVKLSFPNTV